MSCLTLASTEWHGSNVEQQQLHNLHKQQWIKWIACILYYILAFKCLFCIRSHPHISPYSKCCNFVLLSPYYPHISYYYPHILYSHLTGWDCDLCLSLQALQRGPHLRHRDIDVHSPAPRCQLRSWACRGTTKSEDKIGIPSGTVIKHGLLENPMKFDDFMILPLKCPFSSRVSQLAMFDPSGMFVFPSLPEVFLGRCHNAPAMPVTV